jgi:hypothetical protein
MKRRQGEGKTKTRIVIEGVQGKPVAELYHTYQSGQSRYYQWRDEFRGATNSVRTLRGLLKSISSPREKFA